MRQTNDFLKGALIGCVVGGVAALLNASKSGKELRQDIADGCNCIKDTGYEFSENIKKKGQSLMHPFAEEEEESDHSFIIGSAIGVVVSALAALMLAPQSGEKLRASLGDKYDDVRTKAEGFVNNVNAKGHYVAEELDDLKDFLNTIVGKLSHSKTKKNQWHLDDIVDYANLGLRLFQKLKK